MKQKFLILILIALCAITIYFIIHKPIDDGTPPPIEQIKQSLNISIFLDLSDRLIRDNVTPNQTYRDTAIVNHIAKLFKDSTLNSQILKSRNKLKILFYPTPSDSNIAVQAKKLNVDIAALKGLEKRKKLEGMVQSFDSTLGHIYNSTISANNWIGCDIWDFFQSKKVDQLCIQKNSRNIIIIITDGYLFAKNNRIKDGSAYSYILPETLKDPNSELIDNRKEELKDKNLEVLLLEANPYIPQERDPMKRVLTKWFSDMGIEKFVFAETDANISNTETIINNFISQ